MARGGLGQGLGHTFAHPINAAGYLRNPTVLANEGFETLASGNGARFTSPQQYHPQIGDFIVLDNGRNGHMAMLCDDGIWRSDFEQTGSSGAFGGRGFMTSDVRFSILRHKSLMDPTTTPMMDAKTEKLAAASPRSAGDTASLVGGSTSASLNRVATRTPALDNMPSPSPMPDTPFGI